MKIVIFGLSLSSSWGNGHATVWRGLLRAMAARGHQIVFFERDLPFYAPHRDLPNPAYATLKLYPAWEEVVDEATEEIRSADVAIVTSYCPDAIAATIRLIEQRRPLRVFYDLDAPVTLDRLKRNESVEYIGPHGLRDYDLVLSFTGGATLEALQTQLSANAVAVLYGSVDPEMHRPAEIVDSYRGNISYLGTYSADRQEALARLFIQPAHRLPDKRFIIGGAKYPEEFPWTPNIFFVRHLPPGEHASFYSSSPLTLNITRAPMAQTGFCPSGRLFEAAACGTAILSDWWEGLDHFFTPGREIFIAWTPDEAMAAINRPRTELEAVGRAARERVLAYHSAERRAEEFETILIAELAVAPRLVRSFSTAARRARALTTRA